MKNFFELFGFLSTALLSAALVFVFLGKRDGASFTAKGSFEPEMEAVSEVPMSPKAISDKAARPEAASVKSAKREKAARNAPAAPAAAPDHANAEQKLRALYADEKFISATAKQWKGLVRDAADEYNLKPQVLLAHLLVQRYLGDYSHEQLYQDAARHAGERLKPTSTALKGYRYGWSMQKLMDEHDLARFFPEEKAAAAPKAVASTPVKSAKANSGSGATASKSLAKTAVPVAKTNPAEEGFKAMVAKEYGFGSWAGLQKLADPDTKAEAQRRVKSLLMASKVR